MARKRSKLYRVVWEIDIDAASPREAAKRALKIQRDPASHATIFTVVDFKKRNLPPDGTFVDLLDYSESLPFGK